MPAVCFQAETETALETSGPEGLAMEAKVGGLVFKLKDEPLMPLT